ncbi:porin family protein [Undibacterium sp. Di24W]|uniref:porin family protein n=1 Tax=Undibacterium sp. Di24W TaxID=3413033 RepID=UPI003BF3642E
MKKLIFSLIASSFALAAQAENTYLGAGITSSRYDVNINLGNFVNHKSSTSVSAKLFAGYELDKTWALETGYADLGSISTDWAFSGRKGTAKLAVQTFYVAGKGSASINDQFSLFGKLGLAHSKFKQSGFPSGGDETKTGLYGSVGTEFALSKQTSLSLEWERFGQSNTYTKNGSLTAAARYSF